MAENIITATFAVESEAYQAMNSLKRDFSNRDYIISHVELVKNTHGHFDSFDSFDSGVNTLDDRAKGGVVGSLVGILGGPIGVILGGSWGALVGSAVDAGDATREMSLLEKVSHAIPEGKTALLILAQEKTENAITQKLSDYQKDVLVQSAAEVAEEIEEARKLQAEMEKETRKRLREEKKADRKQKVQQKKEEISAKFNAFKEKQRSK